MSLRRVVQVAVLGHHSPLVSPCLPIINILPHHRHRPSVMTWCRWLATSSSSPSSPDHTNSSQHKPDTPSSVSSDAGSKNPLLRASSSVRRYYYSVDDHGRLYLDGVKIRNQVTCLKDGKFLDFFFKNVQSLKALVRQYRSTHPTTNNDSTVGSTPQRDKLLIDEMKDDFVRKWPWISKCGNEYNHLQCDTTPIVYHTLRPASSLPTASAIIAPVVSHSESIVSPSSSAASSSTNKNEPWVLGYAYSLSVPFDPDQLRVDVVTGKLFHPAPPHIGGYALLRSALALELGSGMAGAHSIGWQLKWQGRVINLPSIEGFS